MVNSIIDGISIKLNTLFGDNYEIYSENIEQGLKTPCFFILLLNPMSTLKLGNRQLREYNFDIHYFPHSYSKNQEINEVIETLIDGLEYITLLNSDLIRGTDMHAEIIDDVLHFFINYKMYIRKEAPVEETMETLEMKPR